MKLARICQELKLENLTPSLTAADSKEIATGFSCDVMSEIVTRSHAGGVLVTILKNMYVLAVAYQADFDAIIFAGDRRPAADIVAKAVELKIPLFRSAESAFDVAGRLYGHGLRGPMYR
ncbi:MAG: hypothetical protein ABIF71_08255 [Planctomycetota bacterium]